MSFIDIAQLGHFVNVRTNKEELRFNCPFCEDEDYHLYVNIKKLVYFCVRCNAKGRTNVSKDTISDFTPVEGKVDTRTVPLKLPPIYKDGLTPTAIRYLGARGIKQSDVLRHKLYCASTSSIYFGRIIIPCNPFAGFCDYFVARSYTKFPFPKYLNPSGSKNHLFISPTEHDQLFPQYWKQDEVMLVEGPFDYLKASRHGPTVCLLGKSLSIPHAMGLVARFSRAYVMLDQGMKESLAALKVHEMLNPYMEEVRLIKCPKDDPGEMIPEDFNELLNQI